MTMKLVLTPKVEDGELVDVEIEAPEQDEVPAQDAQVILQGALQKIQAFLRQVDLTEVEVDTEEGEIQVEKEDEQPG